MKDLYVILAVVLTMNTAYVDQLDTGSQGRYNCLPTSIEIASNIKKNYQSNFGMKIHSSQTDIFAQQSEK